MSYKKPAIFVALFLLLFAASNLASPWPGKPDIEEVTNLNSGLVLNTEKDKDKTVPADLQEKEKEVSSFGDETSETAATDNETLDSGQKDGDAAFASSATGRESTRNQDSQHVSRQKTTSDKGQKTTSGKPVQSAPQYRSPVTLTGTAAFKERMNRVMELLHTKSPHFEAKVDKYLQEIVESDHSGVYVETGVFHIGHSTLNAQEDIWIASVLVHDANHVELYQQGQVYSGQEGEALCLEEQKKALRELGAPDSYLTYLDEVLSTNYWETPYENRQW